MTLHAEPDLKRHRAELSERDTDEVIGIVADLIVTFLEKNDGCSESHHDSHRAHKQEGRR